MYDENDLYNELVGTLKTAGKGTINVVEELIRLYGANTDTAGQTANLTPNSQEFVFTGQSTDLGYFANYNEMPIQMIESIPDENIKFAVKDEFRKAALSGKINIDNQNGIITLTPKGKEFIEKPEFKRAASENISRTIAESQMQSQIQTVEFELKGTINDLNYFNHSDTLYLKDVISSSNKEAVQNVLGNLGKMEKSGLISVSDTAVKLTEKGKTVLNSEVFKLASKGAAQATASGATDAAIGAAGNVAGIVVVCVKKVVDVGIKAVEVGASLIKK